MPILSKGRFKIDHTDDGAGPPVILIHSSVSGNRQWRALTDELKDRYRVLAINLFGYGETTPWSGAAPQSLYAQAHWKSLDARTLVVSDAATRLPIREIVTLFARTCPHWTFHTIPGGGHMAPLTRPELINPVVRRFLDGEAA